jgi:CHASE2 domain-containing sensor protein
MANLLNRTSHHISMLSTSIRNCLSNTHKRISERTSLRKELFVRSILMGFIVSIIVTIVSWLGYFKVYEYPLTDFLQNITHKRAKEVALLFITEKEYKEGFHSTSPLSRDRLADTIDTLVKLKAKVIALDIDLSDSTNEDERLSDAINRANAKGIPVVIVGNLKPVDDEPLSYDNAAIPERPYRNEALLSSAHGVELFKEMNPGSQWRDKVMHGAAAFRLDSDGVFRLAEAFYTVKGIPSKSAETYRRVPSFPITVGGAYQGMSQEDLLETLSSFSHHSIALASKVGGIQHTITIPLGEGGKVSPNFIGDYHYYDYEPNLTRLLQTYGPGQREGETIFKGKVVIVGGSYDQKDFYMTPVGRISGMEILANITQNILSGNLITHNNFFKAFTIEVLLGIIVAFIFLTTSRLWAYTICCAVFLPAVIVSSFLSFSNAYHWFDFVPTVAGVMLHETVHDLEKTLKSARSRVQGLLSARTKKAKK